MAVLETEEQRTLLHLREFEHLVGHVDLRAADQRFEELEETHLELDVHVAVRVAHALVVRREDRSDGARTERLGEQAVFLIVSRVQVRASAIDYCSTNTAH